MGWSWRAGLVGVAMLVGAGAAGAGAWGASIDGLSLPDHYPVAGQRLVLNGIGIRTLTIFHVKVYVAGLYLPSKSRDAAGILASSGTKVVLMQFLHAASKGDIEKQYREGEARNCGHGECAPADEGDFERLIAATPARAVGQTLTYIVSDKGLRVLADDAVVGEYANADLAMRILAGFIGGQPPSMELKAALLGG